MLVDSLMSLPLPETRLPRSGEKSRLLDASFLSSAESIPVRDSERVERLRGP